MYEVGSLLTSNTLFIPQLGGAADGVVGAAREEVAPRVGVLRATRSSQHPRLEGGGACPDLGTTAAR